MLSISGNDGTLVAWNIVEGKQLWKQTAHAGGALCLASGPAGELVTGGRDGRIAVYSTTGNRLARSNPVGDELYTVAFGRDAKTVYAGCASGKIHRYVTKGNKLAVIGPLQSAASGPSQ